MTIFGFTANKIAIAPTNTKSADRLSKPPISLGSVLLKNSQCRDL
nr:MAG TPA: hypothetical protein [Caudoviricetes sp.]